jgi:hypothetical protein
VLLFHQEVEGIFKGGLSLCTLFSESLIVHQGLQSSVRDEDLSIFIYPRDYQQGNQHENEWQVQLRRDHYGSILEIFPRKGMFHEVM